MSYSHLVVVADRHLLDSELLVAHLAVDGLLEAARPARLTAMNLSTVSMVLLDSECDDVPFRHACESGAAIGLLYSSDSATLRQRVGNPAVRLVTPRSTSIRDLGRQLREALSGQTRRLLPRPRTGAAAPVLSPRESEVLALMAQGLANRDIATHLDISPHTVRTHVQSVLTKFNKGNRVSAVGAARLAGLLTQ